MKYFLTLAANNKQVKSETTIAVKKMIKNTLSKTMAALFHCSVFAL